MDATVETPVVSEQNAIVCNANGRHTLFCAWASSHSAHAFCHICGLWIVREEDWVLDHLIPKRWGGSNAGHNLRPAHKSCNSRRRDGRIPAQLPLVPTALSFLHGQAQEVS
jgi:5-methylcytosine-specific restriction endonuclease McrA